MHWIDPDYLPETEGVLDQFLINPHGEIDGFLLTDGLEVHVPPHLSSKLARELRPGGAVRVRGIRPREAIMVAAVAIDTPAGRILDEGPPPRHERDRHADPIPMDAGGIVRQPIHGPKGELRGCVLEDGRIIRLPAHEAERLEKLLVAGQQITARGHGAVTPLGTVIDAREIDDASGRLHAVGRKPKPHHPPHHDAHGRHHGPKGKHPRQ